ncbi:MAG TPA: hypothetical protein DEQ77_11190 [Candidatus Omnitrophica bacterium]|nr:hypothetical protein [Candidatus Omnitrophota bacterium]
MRRAYVSGGISWASSAINTENGAIFDNDIFDKLPGIKISGVATNLLNISLQPAVAVSSSIEDSDKESDSSIKNFQNLQNTLRISTNIYADILSMAEKSEAGISAIGKVFPDFDKLEGVKKWNSNMFKHTLEVIETIEMVRSNNVAGINKARNGLMDPVAINKYIQLFSNLFSNPKDKELIFLTVLLHDIGTHDGTVGHEDKGAAWIGNNLPVYYQKDILFIEKVKWLIGQHVAVGTMFFGERTPHRLLRLLDKLPNELKDNKDELLGALAIITFCDGIGMMDNERAEYYIDTNLMTLQQRKAEFLLYRLRKLSRLGYGDVQLISGKLSELYKALGSKDATVFKKQLGENLDALDYGLAFTESIIKGINNPQEKLDLILKMFCMLAFVAETEDKNNEDIKWWIEFAELNEKGDKIAAQLKPAQVQMLKDLKLEEFTFQKVKSAYQNNEPLFGIFKIKRGEKIFESKPEGRGSRQPMLSISLQHVSAVRLQFIGSSAIHLEKAVAQAKWLSQNIGTVTPVELNDILNFYRDHLQELKGSLTANGVNLEQYITIDKVIEGIRQDRGKQAKDTKFVKKFKGELTDIVGEDDKAVGVTEAGFTHIFGLRHRTANAFVFTPDGKLLLQRRVHNKAESKKFSILGGHVVSGMTYEEAGEEEILQELGLDAIEEKLDNKLVLIGQEGQFQNDDDKGPNNEFRSLYAYILSEKEWNQVKRIKEEIDAERQNKTEREFKEWIEDQQKTPGHGEVWGYQTVKLSDIENKDYVSITEIYSDGVKKEDVEFSSDLLLPLIKGNALLKKNTPYINPMLEIINKLRLSASSSVQFSNSKKDIYIPKSADEAYAAVIMVLTEITRKYNNFKPVIDKDKVSEALSTRVATDVGYVFLDYDSETSLYTWDSKVIVNFSEGVIVLDSKKYYYNIDSVTYEVIKPLNENLLRSQLRKIFLDLGWYNMSLSEDEKWLINAVEEENLFAGDGSDSMPSEAEEAAEQKLRDTYYKIKNEIGLLADAKITEIINWIKSEPNKYFKGKDARILKETGSGIMVIGTINRGIVEKLEFIYKPTISSFSQYTNSEKDIYIPKSADEAYTAVIMVLTKIMENYNIFKPNIDKDKVKEALSTGVVTDVGSVFFDYDYDPGLPPGEAEVTVNFSEGMLVIGGVEDYYYGDTTRYEIMRPFNEELLKKTLQMILYGLVLTEEERKTIELVEKRNFLAGPGRDDENYMEEPSYRALKEAYAAVYEKMKTMTDAKIAEIINWVKSEPNKNLKGEDVYILKRTGLGTTIIGSIDQGIAEKFGFAYETASSSMQNAPDKTGGIDFRALPMTIQPMGSFRGLDFNLPRISAAALEGMDTVAELAQIRNMAASGIIPSGSRVKELVAACAQKGELDEQADDLLVCLADIMKLEEEAARESSPELKEALVIIDSLS